MTDTTHFLPQEGNYRKLHVFQLAECIYALTYDFAHKHLQKGDRTIDQMVQAARSGKQNIAEGSVDGSTSREMELKLTNVASRACTSYCSIMKTISSHVDSHVGHSTIHAHYKHAHTPAPICSLSNTNTW